MRFGGESLGYDPDQDEKQQVAGFEGPNIENKEVLRSREKEPYREYPYSGIMVFGHGFRAERERLSQEARIRVLAAYQLYKDGVAPKIIVTGGMPSDADKEKFGDDLKSNGELMRDFLVNDLGVPGEHVVFEDKSTKTVDNVGHALNVLNEKNPGHDAGKDSYVTVSTGYHMARITEIMKKFGLKSAPVGAEWGLLSRAEEHAKKMRTKEVMTGLTKAQIEKNYEMRLHRYDRYVERLSLTNPTFVGELENEGKWLDAMQYWGYWGPLALAVRGDKLNEIIENNREDIESWLERHPEIEMSIEDIIEGNFDYMELVRKGREVPA